jgi:excisionase family DNA binding protein
MSEAERLLLDGTIDVAGAQEFTGLGRSYLYQLMDAGQLAYTKVGKRRLLPRSELRRLLREGLVGATGTAGI